MSHSDSDFYDFPLVELPDATWLQALQGALSQEPVLGDDFVPEDNEILIDDEADLQLLPDDVDLGDDLDNGQLDDDVQFDEAESVLPDDEHGESLYDSPTSVGFTDSESTTESDEMGDIVLDDYSSTDKMIDTEHF